MDLDLKIQTAHALANLFRSLAVIFFVSFAFVVIRSIWEETKR